MELLEYLEKLEILESEKNWDEILSLVEEAISNYSYSLSLKTYKVKALLNKDKWTDAKELCFKLIKSNPGSSVIHSLLASIFEKTGEIKKAIDEYNKIIFLNPGDTEALKELERLKAGDTFIKDNNLIANHSDSDNFNTSVETDKKAKEDGEYKEDKSEEDFKERNIDEEQEVEKNEDEIENDFSSITYETESDIQEEDNGYYPENINENRILEKKDNKLESKDEYNINIDNNNITDSVKSSDNFDEVEYKKQSPDEIIDDEEPYITYSMAKLLEEQEKFKDAQNTYKKIYLQSHEKKAEIGYKRNGLKRFLNILNNFLVRGKTDE
jgi:tetratricopeptide (TPR) repeat protein